MPVPVLAGFTASTNVPLPSAIRWNTSAPESLIATKRLSLICSVRCP